MTSNYYLNKMLEGRYSYARHVQMKEGMKGQRIEDGHCLGVMTSSESLPLLDKILKTRIVAIEGQYGCKDLYVLVGKAMVKFLDVVASKWLVAAKWFEIACSFNKDELEVWRDLNCMRKP